MAIHLVVTRGEIKSARRVKRGRWEGSELKVMHGEGALWCTLWGKAGDRLARDLIVDSQEWVDMSGTTADLRGELKVENGYLRVRIDWIELDDGKRLPILAQTE